MNVYHLNHVQNFGGRYSIILLKAKLKINLGSEGRASNKLTESSHRESEGNQDKETQEMVGSIEAFFGLVG